jgi:hypothetical protein
MDIDPHKSIRPPVWSSYSGPSWISGAVGFLTRQASARASQITKLQLRRVTLFHSYHFRLANLGGNLSAITPHLQQMLVRSRRGGEVLPRRS